MHTGTGRIIYDPPRYGMKKNTDWWIIVSVDPEITRYYRYWTDIDFLNPLKFEGKGLHQPSFDAHISVIRGEKPYPNKMHLWKKYAGQTISFQYEHVGNFYMRRNKKGEAAGTFFIVSVKCDKLLDIRNEFGFKSDWPMHLTYGKLYDR